MLFRTITFDSNTIHWTNNREFNIMFLRITERYLNDLIRSKGYVYLSEIYEKLGVAWNPEDANPCIRNDGINRITFITFEVFDQPGNSFLVNILTP